MVKSNSCMGPAHRTQEEKAWVSLTGYPSTGIGKNSFGLKYL